MSIDQTLDQIEFNSRQAKYLENLQSTYSEKVHTAYRVGNIIHYPRLRLFYQRDILPRALCEDIADTTKKIHQGIYHHALLLEMRIPEMKKKATIGAIVGGSIIGSAALVFSAGLLVPVIAAAAGAGGGGSLFSLADEGRYRRSLRLTKTSSEMLPEDTKRLVKLCELADLEMGKYHLPSDEKWQKAHHTLSLCKSMPEHWESIAYCLREMESPSKEKIAQTPLK